MTFSEYLHELKVLYEARGQALSLAAPALHAELYQVDTTMGFPVDPALRAAWALANGGEQWTPVFMRPGYLTGYDFLTIDKALGQRQGMRRGAPRYAGYSDPEPRDARIRPGWFQEGWLPFADFGGATLLLMQDYSPSPTGTKGQIIAFTHDPDEISYVAASFEAFLGESLASIAQDPDDFFGDEE